MELDARLCYCFRITKRKVVNFVKQRRPKRASQISECFGAGTGCGWCIPFLLRIHREIVGEEIVEGDDITPAQYEAMRASYRTQVAAGNRERNEYRRAPEDPRPPCEAPEAAGDLPPAAHPGADPDSDDEAS